MRDSLHEVGAPIMSDEGMLRMMRAELALMVLETDDQRARALHAWFAAGAPLCAIVLPGSDEQLKED
jgi:hypothetical protein